MAAVRAISGHAPLVLVVGPAGTGKTTTTARAVRELQAQGRPVVGLAPSGKAGDVLATEAGCAASTLASFLIRHRDRTASPHPPGTTIILDEAGMTGTDDLVRLVDHVRRNGWRLVAVGDPGQLAAVGRGGVFAHWCATVPHHELVEPRRFDAPWEAAASMALRSGDPHAVEAYAEQGRLLTAHPALLARDLARFHESYIDAGRTVAVTTNNAETARSINREIQRHRDPANRCRRRLLADGTSVGVGDQIATRRNDPSLRTDRDEQVRNRHTWNVVHLGPTGAVTASSPDRGTVTLPADYVDHHVELGWAVTGYGNQGDTVDIGLAVLEPGTSRNHAYVAMTRGRRLNAAWMPDPTGTIDPVEQFAGIIAHPPDHDSALATHARLHRDAGLPEPDPVARYALTTGEPTPSHRDLDGGLPAEAIAMAARLDRLQRRPQGRSLDR
jgi:ATP-dependent exoDNAse (exonuclease V) alpha subunit